MEALFGTDLTIILIGHEPQMAYIRSENLEAILQICHTATP
jgi:hypothetical protein